MMMLVDRSGKAVARLIVPVTEGANVITSWVVSRLACSMAARNVSGPVSARRVTVIVAGTMQCSSVSTKLSLSRLRVRNSASRGGLGDRVRPRHTFSGGPVRI